MRILKALSLTFALGVLALAMLGAGGKGNVMPGTKSARPFVPPEPIDAGVADAGRKPKLYMPATKSGLMPLRDDEPETK